MNLTMDILRLLTVKALRGRTWCGLRVFDSPGEPADLRLPSERAPYVAVYVDDGDFSLTEKASIGGGSLFDPGGNCWLVIEVNVAGQGQDNPDPQEDADPTDPDIDRPVRDRQILALTDPALELRIGLIARQCMVALTSPDNPWAELWRILAPDRLEVQVRRGGSGLDQPNEPAFRYASRVMRIHVGLLAEPVPGEVYGPTDFWPRVLAMMESDDQLKGIAGILRDHLDGGEVQPWEVDQMRAMLTNEGVRGIGIGPVRADMRETPPAALDGVTVGKL